MSKIDSIKERLSMASPYPWQWSYFVENHLTDKQKIEATQKEDRTIRGPGKVKSPECNPVFHIDFVNNPYDLDLIINAPNDLNYLISLVERLERVVADYINATQFMDCPCCGGILSNDLMHLQHKPGCTVIEAFNLLKELYT